MAGKPMEVKPLRTLSVLRKKLGLNQTALAAKVKINQVDLSAQENSATPIIRKDAFAKLAEILDVDPPEDLLLPYEEYVIKHHEGGTE
jgi:transcriptional regulator with XRE-family HTH domain